MNNVTERKVGMSNELAAILMGGDEAQQMRDLRRIISNNQATAKQRMEVAYEYLGFILGKPAPENQQVDAVQIINTSLDDVQPLRKYNRIPFEKKHEIINIYLNNDISMTKISSITGVNKNTVHSIIRQYKEKSPGCSRASEK